MIPENLERIREEIVHSAAKAGRSPKDIKLVAVSKRFPVDIILKAFHAGQRLFGENYIQEVTHKREELPPEAKFHFIGHLQSNKAKVAAQSCAMIETVDRLKLAKILNTYLGKSEKKLQILVQVNIGNEPQKSGVLPEDTEELLTQLQVLANLDVRGLMTMPPFETNPELSRPHFSRLRQLLERLKSKGFFKTQENPELSMGMSNDFKVAIEEGATIVRVGTAIFGNRPPL